MTSIILETLASISVTIWLLFLTRQTRKLKDQIIDHKKKLYSADRDIKTLHFNQKVLQSNIKDLRKDLKIYGEVKNSKVKNIFNEIQEEE